MVALSGAAPAGTDVVLVLGTDYNGLTSVTATDGKHRRIGHHPSVGRRLGGGYHADDRARGRLLAGPETAVTP